MRPAGRLKNFSEILMKMKSTLGAALLGITAAGSAFADAIPYPTPGTLNATTYTFTATATGDLSAYYLGSTAAYTESLGLLVNSVDTGITGLKNHGAGTVVGQQLDFGQVTQGDVLTFYIQVESPSLTWYSDASLNADQLNHVYATSYSGGDAPAGTYVAFEDLYGGGDLNYHDETFVLTNVSTTPAVPEPASIGLLLAGLGLMGAVARRRRG
jgi:hypothetical protein